MKRRDPGAMNCAHTVGAFGNYALFLVILQIFPFNVTS